MKHISYNPHLIFKQLKFSALVLLLPLCSIAQQAQVVAGTLKMYENFQSKNTPARNVEVWLPEGYTTQKKYNVLYMHDGQMLYDGSTTWNKTAWDVDDVLTKLIREHKIKDVIVVGIWNGGKTRHSDYFPQKPYESLTKEQQICVDTARRSNGNSAFNGYKINSDGYLKFIVYELKPFIDSTFSTYKDRKHTFIAGSSMGGLISLYAICEYPEVFGGAACLSTHWPGIFTIEKNPVPEAFINYLKNKLPNRRTHKIYFDHGTETLDAMYPDIQKKVDEVMRAKHFNKKHWTTRILRGENHSEKAWNSRFEIPILFLM